MPYTIQSLHLSLLPIYIWIVPTFRHYVIPNSLHPLLNRIHTIVRKTRLGEFWRSVWRNYGHAVVLRQSQVEWIIKAKNEGRMTNEEIARAQCISVSRVQQLNREYRQTGTIPVLRRAGRP